MCLSNPLSINGTVIYIGQTGFRAKSEGARVEVDERYKVTSGGVQLARLLTTRHKFVCLGVTSRADIDCARSYLCQARYLCRESIGTETRGSWVRAPRETDLTYLELKNLSTALNMIYIT